MKISDPSPLLKQYLSTSKLGHLKEFEIDDEMFNHQLKHCKDQHPHETDEESYARAVYRCAFHRHGPKMDLREFAFKAAKWAAAWGITVLALLSVIAVRAHGQIDCIKFLAADGVTTRANYCAPFKFIESPSVTFAKDSSNRIVFSVSVSSGITGVLTVPNGGTGAATLTAHSILLGNGTSAITFSAVGATNTLLHGNTGADPTYSVVTPSDAAGNTSGSGNFALVSSPAFSATPTTPTATTGTNTTQIASTAFVVATAGSAGSGFAYGGDGSDGPVDLDGTNTYPNFTSTQGVAPNLVYTLTRDVYATTLIVELSKTLKTGNLRIFGSISVTVNGTAHNSGTSGSTGGNASGTNNGTGGSAGGAGGHSSTGNFSSTSLPNPWNGVAASAGIIGKNGAIGAGTTGGTGASGQAPATNANVVGVALGGAGTTGGAGGNVGGTLGGGVGPAGAQGTGSSAFSPPREPFSALRMRYTSAGTTDGSPFGTAAVPGGGGSGGSGAGDGVNVGGGGGGSGGAGGGGGFLVIASPSIIVGASGAIQSNGATGGPGGNGGSPTTGTSAGGGGGSGGPGGSGGVMALIYHALANSGSITCTHGSGGAAGAKGTGRSSNDGTAGSAGATGNDGVVIQIPI